VRASENLSAAISEDGEVWAWGECIGPVPVHSELDYPVRSLELGISSIIVIDEKNKIFSWGRNDFGQLGLGDKFDREEFNPIEELRDI
jgi:alpha-tubulin suppressor-like RCC1 family protein